MPAPKVLWRGRVDDAEYCIVSSDGVEPFIEKEKPDHTDAETDIPDDECARVYLAAFLEARGHLEKLYDRDMGNLNLKTGVAVLEGAGQFLGRDD